MLTNEGFDRLMASDKIRLLLHDCNIPSGLPFELGKKVLLVDSCDEAYKIALKFREMSSGWFEARYIIDEDNIDSINKAISLVSEV
jgi:hypothetical protein